MQQHLDRGTWLSELEGMDVAPVRLTRASELASRGPRMVPANETSSSLGYRAVGLTRGGMLNNPSSRLPELRG